MKGECGECGVFANLNGFGVCEMCVMEQLEGRFDDDGVRNDEEVLREKWCEGGLQVFEVKILEV